MSTAVVAPAPAIKAIKVKKASAPKKAGTDYVGLIKTAILELKERGGSSVLAIRKALAPKIPKAVSAGWELRLSGALKSMVKSGKLVSEASPHPHLPILPFGPPPVTSETLTRRLLT